MIRNALDISSFPARRVNKVRLAFYTIIGKRSSSRQEVLYPL